MFQNKSQKNITKNQHYVPEFVLRRFTNQKGKLYEVLLSEKKIYSSNPRNSMSAKFVYEDNQLKVNAVERYFSKIEGEAATMVENLVQYIDDYKKNKKKFKDIKTAIENLLPIFLIFYYRSGALLTEFSSINQKDKIPLLFKKIYNSNYIYNLAKTIKFGYEFAIIESSNFLLSDQFISTAALKIKANFSSISNRHIGIKETLILIPISSKYYGTYWHSDGSLFLEKNEINILNKAETKKINQTIINNSYVKCISSKENDLKHLLNNYKMQSPSQIYIGYKSGLSSGYILKKEVFFNDIDKIAYDILPYGQIYIKTGRNDLCPCKSGKKFKKCHDNIIERIKMPIQILSNQVNFNPEIFRIPNAKVVELPIDEWDQHGSYRNH